MDLKNFKSEQGQRILLAMHLTARVYADEVNIYFQIFLLSGLRSIFNPLRAALLETPVQLVNQY